MKNRKTGFTLVELVFAIALSAVLFGQMAVVLVASQKLLQETMGDMELSLSSRLLREKLLFKINGEGGLLSARKSRTAVNVLTAVGASVSYTPGSASANELTATAGVPMFTADRLLDNNGNWLREGTARLASTDVFSRSNNTIFVSMELQLAVGNRIYRQGHKVSAPALCMVPMN
ncbi:MAG: prepilin-type N-terminal cleavage/methylation domain-containing protein [Kiritimatiellae bacterium]|nr:prepilin-type N-terminal cleavage/methylation domain-containing protein [Kiritimatiellia bacterium]